ncbi:MAG TPA: HipA domain-containing protein [Gammaproteobacteria bacterium]
MAKALWGKVYLKDVYAGRLQEEPGGRCVFTYDAPYLDSERPAAIAHTLPLRREPYTAERGLHPFFDNLVAEGWFRNAQARALGIDSDNRFALLLGFGHDLAGAVSVEDPEPAERQAVDHADEATIAALLGRASLSGVQRKLLVVKDGNAFRPVGPDELSTHIAKLPSGNLAGLLELEYLTTQAVRALLPGEDIVDTEIVHLAAIKEDALIIPRFDRTSSGKRIHFEEFNQLLGKYSGDDKYEGAYEDLGQFVLRTPSCIPAEADRLLRRILACLLTGNTDAHFKNFAMFHARDGLRLTPAYDLVAGSVYPEYQTIALQIAGAKNLGLGQLHAKHIVAMSESFGVNPDALVSAVEQLGKRLPQALAAIEKSATGSEPLKKKLQETMERRWNGSFASTGQLSSKRQSKGEKARS